jgi:hypothetical protein
VFLISVLAFSGFMIGRKTVTLSWYKVTKDQVSREASLPHLAFAPQIRQNLGLQTIAPLRSCKATLLQIFAMPFPSHRPPLFCLISPEAVLLTG